MLLDSGPALETRLSLRDRPAGGPAMYHSWRELLFLHWRIEPSLIQSQLPVGLSIDTFDGDAWIGIVVFFMRNIRPWWSPAVPGVSDFQEVNLRTYAVDENGIPGVWFLSLDANSRFGAWWGRTFFRLPYSLARMSHGRDESSGWRRFETRRQGTRPPLTSQFAYRPRGAQRTAKPGTLEFFLVERYVLFVETRPSRIATGRVYHPPYEFTDAEVAIADDALFELSGLPRPRRPPEHALLSRGVDVEVFRLQTPVINLSEPIFCFERPGSRRRGRSSRKAEL